MSTVADLEEKLDAIEATVAQAVADLAVLKAALESRDGRPSKISG